MKLVVLDFETYWDTTYTLKKMTTEEYVRDPRFETIGVGLNIGEDTYWLEHEQFAAFAKQAPWHEVAVAAHHTHFDGLILSHYYGVVPKFYYDTLSMFRALHQTESRCDLDSALQFYSLGRKATPPDTAGMHRHNMNMVHWLKYGEYCKQDVSDCKKLLHRMAVVEQFPIKELRLIDLTVRLFTEPVFHLDEPVLRAYMARQETRKEKLLSDAQVTLKELRSPDKFAAILRDIGVEPQMKAGKPTPDGRAKQIYAFAKTDPFMQGLLESPDEDERILAEARIGARSTLNESRGARLLRLGAGGRAMPVYLTYAVARTTRWAGADSLNWQNFEQLIKGQPEKGMLRKAVIAPPGFTIVGADSRTIEARVTAWLAQQLRLLAAFRNDEDVYSQFATEIYQRPIDRRKVDADYLPGQVGKACVLGLGFGMGFYKAAGESLKGTRGSAPIVFTQADVETMRINPRPFLSDGEKVKQALRLPSRLSNEGKLVHCLVWDYLVRLWRDKNPEISGNDGLWKQMDTALRLVYSGKEMPYGFRDVLQIVPGGILLPSGLVMKLTGLRHGEDGFEYQVRPGEWVKIYGAKLTENIVQALARTIVAYQMLELSQKYHIAMMEHDKIIAVVPETEAPFVLSEMVRVMGISPDFAPDLPVAAEGGFSHNFGEAK